MLEEAVFRELFYAHFGDYDSQWSDLGSLPWLDSLKRCVTLDCSSLPSVSDLVGRNSYLEVSVSSREEVSRRAQEAVVLGGRGTRITLVSPESGTFDWSRFEPIECEAVYGGPDALRAIGLKAAWCGKRPCPSVGCGLK